MIPTFKRQQPLPKFIQSLAKGTTHLQDTSKVICGVLSLAQLSLIVTLFQTPPSRSCLRAPLSIRTLISKRSPPKNDPKMIKEHTPCPFSHSNAILSKLPQDYIPRNSLGRDCDIRTQEGTPRLRTLSRACTNAALSRLPQQCDAP